MKLLTNRWIHFLLLFGLLYMGVHYSGSNSRWREELQYLVFDELNERHPREASDLITIVDIDDDSLARLGQWPWPRTTIAKMVTAMTDMGAKVIAFDGVLAEPDRSSPDLIAQGLPDEEGFQSLKQGLEALDSHDEILAKAIKESRIFVAGYTYGSYSGEARKPGVKRNVLIKRADKDGFLKFSTRFETAAVFLPVLEKASAGNGSFMAVPDHDGVLRRAGLVFSDGKQLYPALSLEALRIGAGYRKDSYRIGTTPQKSRKDLDTNYRLVIGDYKIPVEEDGKIFLRYRKFDESGEDYLSAYKLLDPEQRTLAESRIKDRYVLIGASAEGLKDLRSTALEPFQPGVEIHANALEQILQNDFLLRPQEIELAEASFILISGLLMIFVAPFVHMFVMMIVCVGLIALAFAGSQWAYVSHGFLLDPFYPSMVVFAIFMLSNLLTFLRVESEKKQVRDAFGLYISPDFMQELTKDPDKLKLGGETKDLTVMFTDIRSFTTICEGLAPEEIIQLMNDFLTPMSDMVMKNRGTIDKYMGDAMMAFWNAPLDDEDHERNACLTALSMQAALEPINEEVKAKAKELGKTPVLLNAGIGINTGPCAVGNMGSRQRFAYSTLGDAVNLASRLEGQTKNYGLNILIGEQTWRKVSELACLEMDLIKVKGKTKPERIFALLATENVAKSKEFKALAANHVQMIDAYRGGRFEEAKEMLKACKTQKLFDLEAAYKLYEERIDELLFNPPEGKWDGVFEATSK